MVYTAGNARAGVVKLADARDSKSRGVHPPCGFDSHLRHQVQQVTTGHTRWNEIRQLSSPVATLISFDCVSQVSEVHHHAFVEVVAILLMYEVRPDHPRNSLIDAPRGIS